MSDLVIVPKFYEMSLTKVVRALEAAGWEYSIVRPDGCKVGEFVKEQFPEPFSIVNQDNLKVILDTGVERVTIPEVPETSPELGGLRSMSFEKWFENSGLDTTIESNDVGSAPDTPPGFGAFVLHRYSVEPASGTVLCTGDKVKLTIRRGWVSIDIR